MKSLVDTLAQKYDRTDDAVFKKAVEEAEAITRNLCVKGFVIAMQVIGGEVELLSLDDVEKKGSVN